jgi:hypothetical protein
MAEVPRLADRTLRHLIAELPTALLLVGPRAAGKTTTLSELAAETVPLDHPTDGALFRVDPDAALADRAEPLLLDEWQAAPEVLGAVKRSLDAPGGARPGRYLLTGSVREDLIPSQGTWAGTGRLTRLRMYGLTAREMSGATQGRGFVDRAANGGDLGAAADAPDITGYVDLALRGGFPQAALISDTGARTTWLTGYVDQLVARDLTELLGFSTREPDKLRNLLVALAINSAGIVSDQSLMQTIEVTRQTLNSWERILDALFIVEHMPAWRRNRNKRLVAAPKRYIVDPAIWGALLGVDRDAILNDANLLGRAIDTFVAAQLRAELDWTEARHVLHHVRDHQGREVDLVAELTDGRLVAMEVKASPAPNDRDVRHLRWFRDENPQTVACVLFHTGPRSFTFRDGVQAVSISALWGPGAAG